MTPDPSCFRLGDEGSRAAVLCLHGLTGTPWEVRPPAEALAVDGFFCEGPILPGHCTTPAELAETPRQDWVDAALEAWDRLNTRHDRVYVLGLSLGGVLSLALCQQREVPAGVILAAPLRLARSVHLGVPVLKRLIRDIPKIPGILDPEARAAHPGYDRMPLPAVHELLQLMPEVERRLDEISNPLQLIYSHKDETVATGSADIIRNGVKSQRIEVEYLEDSGHVLPVDQEHASVAATVVDFLGGLERAAVDGR